MSSKHLRRAKSLPTRRADGDRGVQCLWHTPHKSSHAKASPREPKWEVECVAPSSLPSRQGNQKPWAVTIKTYKNMRVWEANH